MTENRAIELLEYIRKTGNGEAPYVGCAQEIAIDMSIQALEEIQQYRAIGTIEEFKDLKEKSTPKKPILSKSMITEKEYQICPICERLALYDGIKFDYCQYCGQKLDW